MGKNTDLAKILLLVIIAMFIPFLGSLAINYGFNLSSSEDLIKVLSTFGYFLLIFGLELLIVYIYYAISNKLASKKLDKLKPK